MYRDSTEAEDEGEGVTEVVTGVVFEAAAAEDTVLTGATVAGASFACGEAFVSADWTPTVAEDVASDSWSLRTPSCVVVPICFASYTFPL
jgi:hypothetical protein